MNREKVKSWAYFFTKPFSFNFLRKLAGENFIFPFYHLVSDTPPRHVKNLYNVVSVGQFRADLEFLLKNYQPATMHDVLAFIKNGKKTEKPLFFLSFDDGMRECFDTVFPILKEKKIEAAFFINPLFVGNRTMFFKHKISLIIEKIEALKEQNVLPEIEKLLNIRGSNKTEIADKILRLKYADTAITDKIAALLNIDFERYLKTEKPFMSLEQILGLQKNNFIIGSHSYDHPEFWELSDAAKQEQMIKSFDYIDKNIHPGIRSFAFPFSDINVPDSFFRFLYDEIKLDVTFGTSGIKKDVQPKHIHRIAMEAGKKNAERIIREEYAYFCLKSIFRKNTIKRV